MVPSVLKSLLVERGELFFWGSAFTAICDKAARFDHSNSAPPCGPRLSCPNSDISVWPPPPARRPGRFVRSWLMNPRTPSPLLTRLPSKAVAYPLAVLKAPHQ